MEDERLDSIINIIAKGDTTIAERLLSKPGGRKYLENIVLIIITNLPYSVEEKRGLFLAFLKGITRIESRIKRQKQGEEILSRLYNK